MLKEKEQSMLRRIGLCALLIVFTSCTIFNSTTISAKKTEYKPMIVDTVEVQPDIIELLKEEVRYTRHWEENCYDDTLQLTYEEAQMLMKLAQAEAGTEGAFGQYLVMKVVINRVNDPAFPNTVEEVITQPHQFSTYANGTYQKAEPTLDSHRALALLEKNVGDDDTIVAFETVSNGNSLLRYFDIAWTYLNHTFYTKKQ
jgi:hypothetical protein